MLVVKEGDPDALNIACDFLCAGKIISFATDTVYGLAADATNHAAIATLYRIKNRDEKKPIAIFVKDLTTAKKIFYFDETSKRIAKNFLRESLTLVLRKKSKNPYKLAYNLNQNDDEFLGFRIVNRPFIKNLLEKFNGILAVTSANISSQKSATNSQEIEKYFINSELSLIVDGGESATKIASKVVKICDKKLTILRPGLTN
jgi:L-threonylcarbamoyladenylate synthase